MISLKLSDISDQDAYWFVFFSRLLVLVALFVLISAVMSRFVIAKGESVPYTLFFSFPGERPALGDYVRVQVFSPILSNEPSLLTKQITCDSGQSIVLTGGVFECDGQPLCSFVTKTRDGRPLQPWLAAGEIPEGLAFIMGSHERSFDSRYLGLVEKKDMTVIRALF